jgi:predicted DNA-binding antitoxin AbrB/MazE fold protein
MKYIEAVYERGHLRPVEPIELPEGTRLRLTLLTRDETSARRTPAEILAEIASLPLEGEEEDSQAETAVPSCKF